MKKYLLIICLALMLAGCKTIADIKPDTIVDIPLHPTEVTSEPATEVTEPPTETESPATQLPTETATEKSGNTTSGGKTGGGKTSGGKTSGGKGSGGSQPPATDPPTQPPTAPPTQPPTEPPTEAPTAPPAYDPTGYSPGSLDRAVADAVNARRQEAGLDALTFDSRLCDIASVRAYELSLEWSHRRPDGSDGLSVLNQYGYGCGWAAENLHNGAGSVSRIVERWMNSDSSAGNILWSSAATIGVGSYTTADGLTYVAAIFVG